jgi:ribosomal subunit interface protein
MQLPVQVTFHDIPHSDAIDAYVRRHASKLESFSSRIIRCRVAVEAPHRHKHEGRHYRVVVDVTVPGDEVVVSRAPGDDNANEDVYAAIDEAFDRLSRRLEDWVRRRRDSQRVRRVP